MTSTEPVKKKKATAEEVLAALFAVKPKPAGVLRVDCVNVFDNRWRINVWVQGENPVVRNQGRVQESYFVSFGSRGLKFF